MSGSSLTDGPNDLLGWVVRTSRRRSRSIRTGRHVGSGHGAARAGGPAVPPGCGRPGAVGEGCTVSQHLLGSDIVLTWAFF